MQYIVSFQHAINIKLVKYFIVFKNLMCHTYSTSQFRLAILQVFHSHLWLVAAMLGSTDPEEPMKGKKKTNGMKGR